MHRSSVVRERCSPSVYFLSGALIMTSGGGLAQSAETDGITTLDRITITAQSREQELQDVPIAINVIDQHLLADLTAENLKDISDFVPGLVIDAQTVTQPTFRLRGIETNDFGIGTDPSVGRRCRGRRDAAICGCGTD